MRYNKILNFIGVEITHRHVSKSYIIYYYYFSNTTNITFRRKPVYDIISSQSDKYYDVHVI